MMFVPSVFRKDDEDLFDDVLNDFWPTNWNRDTMRTDVTEKDGKYVMSTELPGFNKEEIKISLKDGVLNINAVHSDNKDEKDKAGKVVRQERYSGSMERSFYVGKNVKESDIHASYKNGVLTVEVPDNKQVEHKDEPKLISIE